jgi:hypothetical protein
MSWKLPQHIYTSTGRMNFETVAVSPEIDSETLRQLEARAQLYPERRFWGDDATPPFLARGFQITGSKEQYAVSLSYYVGPGLNRPEGNYLSHSYVIDRELLSEQNYNLPWIAACLPCHFKYYPAKGIGADRLDPFEVDFNHLDQYKLLTFVAHELTETGLSDLTSRLMDHLGGANASETLELELPPPHPELPHLYHEDMGQPPEAAPGPDAIRLLRLAGLFAILPAPFKQNPTFIVNEGARAQGSSGFDSYTVRVARHYGPYPAPSQTTRSWFDFSLKLLTEQKLEQLSEVQAWLSSLLPNGSMPSYKVIELGFRLDQRLTAIGNELPARTEDETGRKKLAVEILHAINELEECHVNVDAVYRRVWPILESLRSSFNVCDAIIVFSRLLGSSEEKLPDWFYAEAMRCLVQDGASQLNQNFWRSLPDAVKGRIWERSFRESKPPGCIPTDATGLEYLKFAFTSLKPILIEEPTRSHIIDHLYNSLVMNQPRHNVGPRRQTLPQLIRWRLEVLSQFPDIDETLLRNLVARALSNFYALEREDFQDALSSIVLKRSGDSFDRAAIVMAEFVSQLATDSLTERPITQLLLSLSLETTELRKTAEFLHALDPLRFNSHLASLILVLREMVEVLRDPRRCDTERKDRNIQRFCDWQETITNPSEREQFVLLLQKQLISALQNGYEPALQFCVGVSYLTLSSTPSEDLYKFLKNILDETPSDIGKWSIAKDDLVVGRGRHLTNFLEVAAVSGHTRLGAAVESIDLVLNTLNDRGRYVLLNQLNHYLANAEVPGRVRRDVREDLERVKRARESAKDRR